MEEKFDLYMQDKGLSDNTRSSYINDIKLFIKYYNDSYGEDLEQLIHTDVIMYVGYLKRNNYKASAINRKIAALKQYNSFLVDNNIQDANVIIKKDFIKIGSSLGKAKVLTEQDVDKILHFAGKDEKNGIRDYCMIILLGKGGLRESELVSLRMVDVRLEDRFLNIIGKGNKFREVVINDMMYSALVDYLKERKEIKTDNPYLFVTQKNKSTKKPLNRNFCNRLLDKYGEICNIQNLTPHKLRAFFCTHAYYVAGYSMLQVAAQAGHYSLNTTRGYIENKVEDLHSLSNKL